MTLINAKRVCDTCGKEVKFSEWTIYHFTKRRDFCSKECFEKFTKTYFIKKIYISWSEYGLLIEELIQKIKRDIPNPKDKFDGVYGLSRGGLPIAVAISHALDIPLVDCCFEDTLVVDDVNETSSTLINNGFLSNPIAVLYTTNWAELEPTWCVKRKTDKNSWIIFPYENPETEGGKDGRTID